MSKATKQSARRSRTTPEGDALHLIVDKAIEHGLIDDLRKSMLDWYKQNIDAAGFVAGGDIGPIEPEVPRG